MPMPALHDDDVIKILAAGGGMRLGTNFKSVESLARIATATQQKSVKLILVVNSTLSVGDLVRIASAGNGNVFFEWS